MSDYDLGFLMQVMKHHVASGMIQDRVLAEAVIEARRRQKKAKNGDHTPADIIHEARTD